jgi:hypothetical protein
VSAFEDIVVIGAEGGDGCSGYEDEEAKGEEACC